MGALQKYFRISMDACRELFKVGDNMVRICKALLLLSVLSASAQESPNATSNSIVFVCEHGSAKSVIAAAHFNRLAKNKGLPYRAISRGINPDQEISLNVRRGLAGDGLDVTSWKPQRIVEKDVREADRVITLACKLPLEKSIAAGNVTDWNDVPSVTEDYERARKAIVKHVKALLKSLAVK